MDATEHALNQFSTRISQMLLQAQNDYNSLKMAKMLEVTDGDVESAQKRLQRLIRDVNKCITLLSER